MADSQLPFFIDGKRIGYVDSVANARALPLKEKPAGWRPNPLTV